MARQRNRPKQTNQQTTIEIPEVDPSTYKYLVCHNKLSQVKDMRYPDNSLGKGKEELYPYLNYRQRFKQIE